MAANCVSYESVIASLREVSGSKYADPLVHNIAKDTLNFLNKNPKTADLLKEGLSNASCSDIAQVVQSLSAGVRDAAIAVNAMELKRELPHILSEFYGAGKSLRETTETVEHLGREVNSVYGKFDKGIKDGAYVSGFIIPILLIAAGALYGRKILNRFTSRT